jgi:hypothetical protein
VRPLHHLLPAQFHNPAALALRLLRTRDPDAYAAMRQAALGVLLSPLDLALTVAEEKRYAAAAPPRLAVVLVCGPPRSGTTLVAQQLIQQLPVAYLSNLAGIFPRAPLTAARLAGRVGARWRGAIGSYYGRARTLAAPSDALGLWDRWFGDDRNLLRSSLSVSEREAMRQFFGAREADDPRPLVAKNNRLNGQAALVSDVLPTARFICLERDPVFLAQSLLLARQDINGDAARAYGLHRAAVESAVNPVESVCSQVMFHERLAATQEALLGPERFWRVSYEQFCLDPAALVTRVARELLGMPDGAPQPSPLAPFTVSRKNRLPTGMLQQIEDTFVRLGHRFA